MNTAKFLIWLKTSKKMKINTTILCLILSQFVFGQTELSKEKHIINLDAKIGERIYVTDSIGNTLNNGEYLFKFLEGRVKLSFWFSIEDSGEINGDVKLNIGDKIDSQLLELYKVKKGIVKKIEQFDQKRKFLDTEIFISGDTVIERNYKLNKLLYYENKGIKGNEIYKYSCVNYYEEDYIDKCTKTDFIKGIVEETLKGNVISRTKTKNLPSNILKIVENLGTEESVKKIIVYTDKVIKTTYKNGSYKTETPIKGGVFEKVYNNKGVLIESGKVYDIDF